MNSRFVNVSVISLRLLLGLFLAAAALGKALDIPGYVEVIASFQFGLPPLLGWVGALGVIAMEGAISIALLSGRRVPVAAIASALLHSAYFILLAATLIRGVDVQNCGCFGVFFARPLGSSTLIEDAVLIALSAALAAGAAGGRQR